MERDIEDGVITLTLHPEVIGRGHRLLMLEEFVDVAMGDGLEFTTLATVAERFREGREYGRYRGVVQTSVNGG
ncbi:MAG TPA: hypothetical protein VFA78_01255, partial [Chloroflexota bacterium]|nr:hypothetical protein [Chloroflexota bacterium]